MMDSCAGFLQQDVVWGSADTKVCRKMESTRCNWELRIKYLCAACTSLAVPQTAKSWQKCPVEQWSPVPAGETALNPWTSCPSFPPSPPPPPLGPPPPRRYPTVLRWHDSRWESWGTWS